MSDPIQKCWELLKLIVTYIYTRLTESRYKPLYIGFSINDPDSVRQLNDLATRIKWKVFESSIDLRNSEMWNVKFHANVWQGLVTEDDAQDIVETIPGNHEQLQTFIQRVEKISFSHLLLLKTKQRTFVAAIVKKTGDGYLFPIISNNLNYIIQREFGVRPMNANRLIHHCSLFSVPNRGPDSDAQLQAIINTFNNDVRALRVSTGKLELSRAGVVLKEWSFSSWLKYCSHFVTLLSEIMCYLLPLIKSVSGSIIGLIRSAVRIWKYCSYFVTLLVEIICYLLLLIKSVTGSIIRLIRNAVRTWRSMHPSDQKLFVFMMFLLNMKPIAKFLKAIRQQECASGTLDAHDYQMFCHDFKQDS